MLGSLNMDLVIAAPRMPVMGETIFGKGFMTSPGGKGANQAVAASRLGGEVAMIGCVGDDLFGRELVENLRANLVAAENVRMLKEVPTGVAVITVVNGDNCIILDSGANHSVKPQDITPMESLIKSADILLLQLEIPLETVEKAVEIAVRNGVKVILNPAPALNLPVELLKRVDVLTPNESECEYITGVECGTVEAAGKAAECLLEKGIKQVAVTMGAKGVVYNAGKRIVHKGVPMVKAIDTTAAGDSFSGALAVALSNDKDMDEAIEFANTVATLTVTKKGAQNSLPYLKDVRAWLMDQR